MSVLGRPTWAIFDVYLHWRVTALVSSHINDNYCVTPEGFIGDGWKDGDICGQLSDLRCKLFCCESCTFVTGQPQKKGISPIVIKYVKGVSCVNLPNFRSMSTMLLQIYL